MKNLSVIKNDEELIDKIILKSRAEHAEKLSKVEGTVDSYMEYAETLLRNYHETVHDLK